MLKNSFQIIMTCVLLSIFTISCNEFGKNEEEKYAGFYSIKEQYVKIIQEYIRSNCIDSHAIILFYLEERSGQNSIRITAVKNPSIMSYGIDLITTVDNNFVVLIGENDFLDHVKVFVPEWFYDYSGMHPSSIFDAPTWYYKETNDSITLIAKV